VFKRFECCFAAVKLLGIKQGSQQKSCEHMRVCKRAVEEYSILNRHRSEVEQGQLHECNIRWSKREGRRTEEDHTITREEWISPTKNRTLGKCLEFLIRLFYESRPRAEDWENAVDRIQHESRGSPAPLPSQGKTRKKRAVAYRKFRAESSRVDAYTLTTEKYLLTKAMS